jgi:protein-disulfide isomerase
MKEDESVQLGRTKHLLLGALLLAMLACGRRDEDAKKLDDIVGRLERIEKKLDTPARPTLPRPPEADTKTVYAVPIDGDPFVGPAAAKVTIVEASDFA